MNAIDPRIERGLRAMLELRRERLAGGDRALGWKVGFGSPAGLEQLGIDRPLIGFLTGRGLLPDGAAVSIGSWANPRLEPEIAVHLARDVAGEATWDDTRAAIGGLSAAIELADLDPPPTDPEAILAGNIYHRHVMLGTVDRTRSRAEGITGSVIRDGEEVAGTDTPEALTGEVVEIVRLTAELLATSGERLRAGEVVITGSIVPPLAVSPGQRVTVELPPLDGLVIALRH